MDGFSIKHVFFFIALFAVLFAAQALAN